MLKTLYSFIDRLNISHNGDVLKKFVETVRLTFKISAELCTSTPAVWRRITSFLLAKLEGVELWTAEDRYSCKSGGGERI